MKHIVIIIFILIGSLQYACAESETEIMNHAQTIVEQQPDSALSALQQLLPRYEHLNKKEKARFGLLYFTALDKCRLSLQPMEWISHSVDYYRRKQQNEPLSYSLLYQSRSYWQNYDGRAVPLLMEALELAGQHNNDLRGKIYSDLGTICEQRDDHTQAREYYHRSLQCFEACGHINNQAILTASIGNILYHNCQYDSATVYYRRALTLATDSAIIGYFLHNIAENYLHLGECDSALHYIRLSFHYPAKERTNYPYRLIMLADAHFDMGQYDSARHYARQALNNPCADIYVQKNCFRILANIAYEQENDDLFQDYSLQYQRYNQITDSIERQIPQVSEVKALHDTRIKAERRKRSLILASVGVLLLSIGTALGFCFIRKRHRERLCLLEEQDKEKLEKAKRKKEEEAQRLLLRQEIVHHIEIQKLKLQRRYNGKAIPSDEIEKIYNRHLSLDSPSEYKKRMTELCGQSIGRLAEQYPRLQAKDLLYIYLVLLEADKQDVAVLLGYKQENLRKFRLRLTDKLTLGSAFELDGFIRSLDNSLL